MIGFQTRVQVADNSGARIVQCIKILKGSMHRYASIGDTIITAVKRAKTRKKVKKGEIRKCLVVRVRKNYCRSTGFCFKIAKNAVIVLNAQNNPIATRLFGPVTHELRALNFMRVITMAVGVI
jgi:large subunit ribosomal protein L14